MSIISVEGKTFNSDREYVIYKLMNDSSLDETTSDEVDVSIYDEVSLVVESSAGVSGGVVTLEGAISSDFTGTWASFGTITTSAATTTYILSANEPDGTTKVGLPIKYLRARISTVVSDGTLDVYLMCRR